MKFYCHSIWESWTETWIKEENISLLNNVKQEPMDKESKVSKFVNGVVKEEPTKTYLGGCTGQQTTKVMFTRVDLTCGSL